MSFSVQQSDFKVLAKNTSDKSCVYILALSTGLIVEYCHRTGFLAPDMLKHAVSAENIGKFRAAYIPSEQPTKQMGLLYLAITLDNVNHSTAVDLTVQEDTCIKDTIAQYNR